MFPQPLSPSLQRGFRFFHHPLPPLASFCLTASILGYLIPQDQFGFTVFCMLDTRCVEFRFIKPGKTA
ncbi:hypothetical protein DP117_35950, partial [Brasilonema sp. UFV-L1]|nr:hypothetical protein [Brasilonema sp. UFV-L1]